MLGNTRLGFLLLFCALIGVCQMTPMAPSVSSDLGALDNKDNREDMDAILNDSDALPEEIEDYINTLNNLASEIENAKWYQGNRHRSISSLVAKKNRNKIPFNPQTRWGKRGDNRIPQTRWG